MARTTPTTRVGAAALAGLVAALLLGLGGAGLRSTVADQSMNDVIVAARADAALLAAQVSRLGPAGARASNKVTWALTRADGIPLGSSGLLDPYLAHGLRLPAVGDRQLVRVTLAALPPSECGPPPACELSGRTVTLAAARAIGPDGPIGVYVLASPFAADAAVAALDRYLLPGIGLGILLAVLLAWLATRRALRPVEAIRARLAHISAHQLHLRVPVPRTGDELTRLAVTTNETLDRLEDAVTRQQRFVADAAHELRSPLAALLNTLEVAAAHPDRTDLPQAVQVALGQGRRLQALTEDLLLLARLDRSGPPAQRVVAVDAVVAEQVAERRFATSGGPRFTISARPARVAGDEGQLGRMLRNLLDNAAAHARSSVQVTVAAGQHVDVEVIDDGPGIPVTERDRVFERFARLDTARDRHRGGAGLGLAIARDIATQHGGTIHIADHPRGTRVVVRLPAAPIS